MAAMNLFSALLTAFIVMCSSTQNRERQLLVIMLDGTRWDYIDLMPQIDLGGFKILKEQGVRTEYLEPVTPAMSFPNWRTLETGLFPESHYVIDNDVYDRKTGATFSFDSSPSEVLAAAPWWSDVEPIWTTAMRQGKRVATIGWGRSDVPVHNMLPEVAQGYPGQDKSNFMPRVEEAAQYLQQGFDLVLMHYDELDTLGHRYGPASPQVMDTLRDVGAGFQRLFQLVAKLPHVHVMVVSDHGMTPYCSTLTVNLERYIDIKNDTEAVHTDPGFISIYARKGRTSHLYRQLQAVMGWEVRLRDDIPEEFHVKKSPLAPDLILYGRPVKASCVGRNMGGTHGPVPSLFPDMRGIFFAKGEAFVGGGKVFPPIRSVDVYQIYCHILGIEPRPHNGTWEAVADMLNMSSLGDSISDSKKDDNAGCRGDVCNDTGAQNSGGPRHDRGEDGGGSAADGGVRHDGGGGTGGGNQPGDPELPLPFHDALASFPSSRGSPLVYPVTAWSLSSAVPAGPALCRPFGPYHCQTTFNAKPYPRWCYPRCQTTLPRHFRSAGAGCQPYERRICHPTAGRNYWRYQSPYPCFCFS